MVSLCSPPTCLKWDMRVKARRSSALTLSLLLLLLVLDGVSSYTEFEISVPTRVQTAVYGESVVLSCTFPVSGSWDADSTEIMWQRNLEVVHSFFNGQDQPQYQNQRYANRTSLFHQELKKGNASLRLDRTIVEDAGEYTCSISTQLGSQRKSFSLKVAAFYPEPLLHISKLNDGYVEVLVTSEGGYPSPLLQWLMGNMSDITNDIHTQLRQDQHTRLYSVKSKLDLSGTINSSITFIMKNQDLGQEIRKNINLFSVRTALRPRTHKRMSARLGGGTQCSRHGVSMVTISALSSSCSIYIFEAAQL
ncbi:CD276 antigen-like isoform X2 [Neoarius graeffei]|uniref:CD276 antigen-like isoform X2 n=1 Tax=Neoarius graeffei TaxID=443677 RepID=UPI00298C24D9|nr:CD276 antigen-like isoform X2 [Neoarius graeffei]